VFVIRGGSLVNILRTDVRCCDAVRWGDRLCAPRGRSSLHARRGRSFQLRRSTRFINPPQYPLHPHEDLLRLRKIVATIITPLDKTQGAREVRRAVHKMTEVRMRLRQKGQQFPTPDCKLNESYLHFSINLRFPNMLLPLTIPSSLQSSLQPFVPANSLCPSQINLNSNFLHHVQAQRSHPPPRPRNFTPNTPLSRSLPPRLRRQRLPPPRNRPNP
jgi:hypothetical protein